MDTPRWPRSSPSPPSSFTVGAPALVRAHALQRHAGVADLVRGARSPRRRGPPRRHHRCRWRGRCPSPDLEAVLRAGHRDGAGDGAEGIRGEADGPGPDRLIADRPSPGAASARRGGGIAGREEAGHARCAVAAMAVGGDVVGIQVDGRSATEGSVPPISASPFCIREGSEASAAHPGHRSPAAPHF